MPHIDILPTSTSIASPGYALVPDTRGLPQPAAPPIAGRKRAARNTGFAGGDTTVRQQNAVLKHLAELDKDSHRDVQMPVPSKQKDHAGKGPARKMTSNVRRILMSQKTFANHLADEEAAIAQQVQNGPSSMPKPATLQKISSTPAGGPITTANSTPAANDPLANEPLLRSYVPEAPSAELMDAVTSAPPLSYSAARATLPANSKPPRHFCEICGYWGTIKCLKCGARVCGLECKGAHDDGRCLKFYA
ncbi:MAG: hypothetical protein Q9217_006904 [Psora testacea]